MLGSMQKHCKEYNKRFFSSESCNLIDKRQIFVVKMIAMNIRYPEYRISR